MRWFGLIFTLKTDQLICVLQLLISSLFSTVPRLLTQCVETRALLLSLQVSLPDCCSPSLPPLCFQTRSEGFLYFFFFLLLSLCSQRVHLPHCDVRIKHFYSLKNHIICKDKIWVGLALTQVSKNLILRGDQPISSCQVMKV